MKRLLTFLLFLVAPALLAQTPPHIGYVYPAGGQQGSRFQARIGGQFLNSATNIYVSGGDVQVQIEDYSRPMTAREFNDLRRKLDELREKREAARNNPAAGKKRQNKGASGWTAADERAFNELRFKIAKYQRRPANPAIAEFLTVSMSINSNAIPGTRELRLRTANGLSNPLVFKIGQLPEVADKPGQSIEEPQRPRFAKAAPTTVPVTETKLTLPVVANGQIMSGEVDRFKFRARKGQKLVLQVSARELVPYLPDAVPGWFQPTLALFDAKRNELAYQDDLNFNPDPVICFEVPRDGDYTIELKDSIYRGREDFVYRLSIGELPFLRSIFPLGARAGAEARVEVNGWNLDKQEVYVKPSGESSLQEIACAKGELKSNPLPFARDTLDDVAEVEPNNTGPQGQELNSHAAVNGRIDSPGDVDTFRISGKAGLEIVAEVLGRRLNSPIDSVLRLTDASGQQIASNDDFEDKGAGLTTHQADSKITVKFPKDGGYFLYLSEAQRKGGPEYAYRLRVSQPRPDFELRVVPSSVSVRPGASAPLTVYALRKDGFTNDILLAVEEGSGFSINGGRIPAGCDQVRVTLTATSATGPEPIPVKLAGRAVLNGKVITHDAVPAEDMMQAFFYRHLVPSKELLVNVSGNWGQQRWPTRLVSDSPVKIPCGGVATVRLTAPKAVMSRVKLALSNPPEGVSIQNVGTWSSGAEIVFSCDASKARPGTCGNLIVQASGAKAQGNKAQGAQATPFMTLPAIPYEIVDKN